jgi:DNA-binding NarL/FixJ family response regulator
MQCQKKSKQVHYIALSVAPVDSSVLAQYEAVINLYDDPVDIHLTIDKLMKFNKNHEVEDGELSEREKEIIRSVVKGKSNKQIAEDLNLSVYTVLTHRRNISKKLQIHSASALTIYAISNKLLNINEVKQL